VIEITIAASAGRVPVFAGCSHNATHVAAQRAARLAKLPGLTGILTANPYYNRPSQEGQYQHFRAIADASGLPTLLYNIPGRTGANLEPATVLRLAEIKNVIGIKESSGNLTQITELLTQAPRDFRVFAGDDALALPVLALGGAGLISVASNVIPDDVSGMVRAAIRNDWASARKINRKIYGLMQALFLEPSPAPAKAVLALMGRGADHLRLPMIPVTSATRSKLAHLIGEMGLLTGAPSAQLQGARSF
jgi:4-hydroxy-tetrahydrodipicolinate synthase